VMDKRTRLILFKLLQGDVLRELNGVIATGKESNVYHGRVNLTVLHRNKAVAHHSEEDAEEDEEQEPKAKEDVKTTALSTNTTATTVLSNDVDDADVDDADVDDDEDVPDNDAEHEVVEVAVKIYKTTMNEFKNRSEYMDSGLKRQNPRRVVRAWAEKEMVNLRRLLHAGLSCPEPLFLREHVLMTRFVGSDGKPAPQLKDVQLSPSKWQRLYDECRRQVRVMFQRAHLIHADLSEYNMLYDTLDSTLYFIDVSQSVPPDHPNAMEFLRRDCENLVRFFSKHVAVVLSPQQLFEFVTDPTLNDADVEAHLQRLDNAVQTAGDESEQAQNARATADLVFANRNLFVPHALKAIEDPFRVSPSALDAVVTGAIRPPQ